MRRSPILMSMLVPVLLLAGCVTASKALQGEYAPVEPGDVARSGTTGDAVRWGGRIVAVQPAATHTCFEIVGVQLGEDGRPLARDHSSGRYLACRGGFYDPEIFQSGRELTIIGRVDGFEERLVGEYNYRYPRVSADVIYLWPERQHVDVIVEHSPYYWW